jgi:DNA-binding transcriptional regulator YdaS (Cro superfamily)
MTSGMDLIRAQRGMLAKVAQGLGLTRAAIVKWHQVPAERVVEIERITGIPREHLRPDLYADRPDKPVSMSAAAA